MLERLQRKGFGYERCFACLKALVLASRCASTIIIGRFSHGSHRSNYRVMAIAHQLKKQNEQFA